MKLRIFAAFVLSACALLAAEEPAAPVSPSVGLIKAVERLDALNATLAATEKRREDAFRDTDAFKDAKALHDETLYVLEGARKRRDTHAKLQASSDYVRARRLLESVMVTNVPGEDEARLVESIAAARAEVASLQVAVAAEERRRRMERDAAARRAEFERAFADAPVVNAKMIRNTGDRYLSQVVRLRNWTFDDTIDAYVDYLPNVPAPAPLNASAKDMAELRRWVCLAAFDGQGDVFPRLFAHKATWVDLLNNTKRGTKIDVIGYVIDLERYNEFGLVILDLKILPPEGTKTP
jgi:hypothetical protein